MSLQFLHRRLDYGLAGLVFLTGVLVAFGAASFNPSDRHNQVGQGAVLAQSKSDDESLWERNQKRFNSLSAWELRELKNKKNRFDRMPEEKRQRLRTLHQQIMRHPNRDELLTVMYRYNDWLKSLTEDGRANLGDLTGQERIEEIRKMRQAQAEEYFGVAGDTQLPQSDVPKLFQWLDEFVNDKQEEIRELARNERFNFGRRSRGSSWRTFYILARARPEKASEILAAEDIDSLKSELSPDAVDIIEQQAGEKERQKLIFKWIVAAMGARFDPPVSDRELIEFYNNEMTAEQRDWVDQMTPDRRRQQIRRFYGSRRVDGSVGSSAFDNRGRRRERPTEGEENDEDGAADESGPPAADSGNQNNSSLPKRPRDRSN